jgi:hypothetical protein
MKLLVETTGNFGLYDLNARQVIQANRPTVVGNTPFIQANRGTKLTVLEILADDASDAGLQMAKDSIELEAAIADLPRPPKPEPKTAEPTKTLATKTLSAPKSKK